ncbi:uncharacterized protein HKW66_Vig0116960 [Vigna angularis]|nr:uncharacterized protein HKW66_Vig0116960 [Vigna angularis]
MQCLEELSLMSVQSVDLLYQFPYMMPNLQKLKLTTSYYRRLESRVNFAQQQRLGALLELKALVLLNVKMKDLAGVLVQRKLEVLILEECSELNNLGPPSVSLPHLTYLELNSCSRLRNLMASSTAKSMVQLKTMKVINCREVKEIVSNENEEGKVMKIVFNKLISMELVRLNNLTSFCSHEECEFVFPSLKILIVRECFNMGKFNEKGSITPKLKNVFGVEGDEKAKWQWKGDLNATIQKFSMIRYLLFIY